MFTEEEKLKAINLYKQTGSFAVTKRMLGYPNNPDSIRSWLRDFEKNGCFSNTYKRIERNYSKEEIDFACEYYLECKNIEKKITDIGFPETRMTLWRWLKSKGIILTKKKETLYYNDEEKKYIIREYFSSNQSKTEFAKKYKISPPSITNWIKKFGLTKEDAVVGKDDELIVDDIATPPRSDQEEIDELKREIAKLRAEKVAASRKTKEAEAELKLLKSKLAEAKLEYDILEKAAELLKKINGININTLKNREKAIVINALREKYKLAKG
ncbi:MAG: transposase [Bacilli bacterium]